jgi:hypothetical protein
MAIGGKIFEDEPNVFYHCQKEFFVWEIILLCVWSFFHIMLFFFYNLLQVFQIYTNRNY